MKTKKIISLKKYNIKKLNWEKNYLKIKSLKIYQKDFS